MKRSAILLAALLLPLAAAEAPGVAYWSGSQLKAYTKSLGSKLNERQMGSEQLGKFGNHSFMMAHREASGEAELHETQADVFFVQTGEATIVIGGTMDNPKSTAPNEVRGPGIKGGEKKKLGPGDVLNIPAKTPHQVMVDNGKQITYMVVKIDTP